MAFLAGLRKGDGYRITAMVYIHKCKKMFIQHIRERLVNVP